MFAGMNPTGRRVVGPSADLIEVDDGEDGLKHTALVFHERYREHEALNASLELVEPVIACPLVTGIVEVSRWDRGSASFLYPTGTAWTISEVVRAFRDGGRQVDPRAVVEMLYLAGLVVADASETLPEFGVYSHGSLSPLRVLMKADGQVQLLGYGIPQVEIMAWRDNESNVPHEDAFRYCPPERFEGMPEDGDSDLYCLSLCAYELLTTEFAYDGSLEKIRDAARRGDADKKVNGARQIPNALRQLLMKALVADPDRRIKPAEFVAHVEGLLGEIQGTSLADTMVWVSQNSRRGKALGETRGGRGVPQKGGDAAATVRAAGLGASPVKIVSGPPRPPAEVADSQNRWGKPVRRQEEPEEVEAPLEEHPSYVRARPRQREEAPPTPVAEAPGSGTVEARQALRDRLKKKDAPAEAAPPAAPAAPAPSAAAEPAVDARAALRERLKAKGNAEAPAAAAPQAAAPPAPTPEPTVDPADARAALRERLKAKQAAAEAAKPEATAEPAPAPPAEAPAAAPPAAEESAADARQALRDRLRRSQQVEVAPEKPAAELAPGAEPPAAETPAAAPVAPAEAPAAEPPAPEPAPAEPAPAAPAAGGSLRDRLKAREAAAEPPPPAAPPAPPPAAPAEAAADGARAGESLRDRLKRQKDEAAAAAAPAPAKAPEPATPAPAKAPEPAKAAEVADDPREALRRKLRERRGE